MDPQVYRKIPKPIPGINPLGLPLNPQEFFVLSQVDGVSSPELISEIAALPLEKVIAILQKLESVGAIEWLHPKASPPSKPPEPSPPGTPEESQSLSPQKKQRIDSLYEMLNRLSHYELLGVSPNADRSEVRAAYFNLAKELHPDTAFRNQEYRSKMEIIFRRLTEAYEVLSKKSSREEYDRYLKQAERRRAYEEVLSSSELEMAEILNLSPSPSPSPLASMREQISKTLRKRIDGSKHSPSMPPPPPPSTMEAAPDRSSVLRQLVQSLITTSEQLGGLDQAERLLLQAKRLRANGERAKALAAFRALLALRPEDPSIQAEVQALEHELGLELCQIFREQAIYEEKQEKWEAAARSWLQAIDAFRDDPQALWQSANALIEAGIELPLAKELAERAFELAPQDPRVLRTLARVHLRSGEISKAESLLLQAFRLDPSDLLTHQLLHKLRS